MKYDYPKSIKEAASTLDKIKPDWYKKVDFNILNMDKVNDCILGQVFGCYDDALCDHFDSNGQLRDTIFGSRAAVKDWKDEVHSRMNPVAKASEYNTHVSLIRLGESGKIFIELVDGDDKLELELSSTDFKIPITHELTLFLLTGT